MGFCKIFYHSGRLGQIEIAIQQRRRLLGLAKNQESEKGNKCYPDSAEGDQSRAAQCPE